jgi:hypothetical protein
MPFADVLFSTNFILFPSDARGRSRMARGPSREREPAAGERKICQRGHVVNRAMRAEPQRTVHAAAGRLASRLISR